MSWYARVCQLHRVKAGESVGYGRTWIASRESRIAVVSVGYGDGLSRSLSNIGELWIKSRRAPIVGRVCMDLTMLDVTEVPGVEPGDIAEIFGTHIAVEEVAEKVGTISYEVLCNVGKRVPRVYV
jgi:alanine racemase